MARAEGAELRVGGAQGLPLPSHLLGSPCRRHGGWGQCQGRGTGTKDKSQSGAGGQGRLCAGWRTLAVAASSRSCWCGVWPRQLPFIWTQGCLCTGLPPRWGRPSHSHAQPACTMLKPPSHNWQFRHIYSQQISLSGASWGSLGTCREIGLKWRVRFFSPAEAAIWLTGQGLS